MNPIPWTDDRITSLRSHWAAGLSCSKIAAELGGGATRNSVIGKIYRMGLSKPFVKKVKQSRAPREHKPKLHFILSNANSSVQRIIETREAADMIKLRCAEVVPRNLTLLELGQHDCKYPYGDGPFVFCGHPKLDGSSYCQPHFSLTQGYMRTMTDAERQRRRQSYADRNRLRA